MLEATLADYIGVETRDVQRLLRMKQSRIYDDPTYQAWIAKLDANQLHQSLNEARAAYEKMLPQFSQQLSERYNMNNTPMSPFTLGNWLVGFLQYPDAIRELSQKHNRLPREAVIDMLPEMLSMMNGMKQGRADWQKALALMALPLAAERD